MLLLTEGRGPPRARAALTVPRGWGSSVDKLNCLRDLCSWGVGR